MASTRALACASSAAAVIVADKSNELEKIQLPPSWRVFAACPACPTDSSLVLHSLARPPIDAFTAEFSPHSLMSSTDYNIQEMDELHQLSCDCHDLARHGVVWNFSLHSGARPCFYQSAQNTQQLCPFPLALLPPYWPLA